MKTDFYAFGIWLIVAASSIATFGGLEWIAGILSLISGLFMVVGFYTDD